MSKSNIKNFDCVMFVRDNPRGTVEKLNELGIETIEIPSIDVEPDPIETLRWKYFLEYLEDKESKYANVFITDVRDVIFQDDVFERYKQYNNYIVFALESMLISEEPTNTLWMKRDFGEAVFNEVAKKAIICGGTICGSVSEIIRLAKIMNEINGTHNQLRGLDQAALNYMVWCNKLPTDITLVKSSDDGDIATIGWVQKITGKIYRNKIYVNGNMPAVVHQYDRDKHMMSHVIITYADINNVLQYLRYNKVVQHLIDSKDDVYLWHRKMMKPIETKLKEWFR